MQTENESPTAAPERQNVRSPFRRPRLVFRERPSEIRGQAIIEFAIVSIAFFMMVFGTIDFGRVIYLNAQLNNAVREGARYGKIAPTDQAGIKQRVADYATTHDLSTSDVIVSYGGSCSATSTYVEVTATSEFQAITQEFLGISPIDLVAKAHVGRE